MLLIFIISYPLLVHLSVLIDLPSLQALAIVSFTAALLYSPLSRGHKGAWATLAASVAIAWILVWKGVALLALYLPPVLLPLMLLIVFGRTLRQGREPLVTAMGEQARGPLDDRMRRYTRRVTQVWCLVFLIMSAWSAFLPWLGDDTLWSWFVNVINYALVGSVFIAEFLARKWLFPNHDHPGFIEYLGIVAKANVK